jgi:septation ring formation regulator EzrA
VDIVGIGNLKYRPSLRINQRGDLEALEKKKNSQTERISSRTEKKVKGSQMAGNSQKMFRRKSGSA